MATLHLHRLRTCEAPGRTLMGFDKDDKLVFGRQYW